jgi:hypothetical protein
MYTGKARTAKGTQPIAAVSAAVSTSDSAAKTVSLDESHHHLSHQNLSHVFHISYRYLLRQSGPIEVHTTSTNSSSEANPRRVHTNARDFLVLQDFAMMALKSQKFPGLVTIPVLLPYTGEGEGYIEGSAHEKVALRRSNVLSWSMWSWS